MNISEYLGALEVRLRELGELVISKSIESEVDTNLEIGFIMGYVAFVDGSRLEFIEQLPTERRKFRLHYMDAQGSLIVRWDSAPHHRALATFPFHKHTPEAVVEHDAITLIEAQEEITHMLRL
jgi:hypothetical protein